MTKKQKTQKTILTIIMFAFALAVLFPFIWMLFCSFKPLNEIYEFPPRFLSGNMSLKNYRQVLFEQNPSFLTYLKNTAVTTVVSVLGTVITSSMAGYAFAKMKFRCRDQLFLLYLITMMVPFQVLMVPQFIPVSYTHLPGFREQKDCQEVEKIRGESILFRRGTDCLGFHSRRYVGKGSKGHG